MEPKEERSNRDNDIEKSREENILVSANKRREEKCQKFIDYNLKFEVDKRRKSREASP